MSTIQELNNFFQSIAVNLVEKGTNNRVFLPFTLNEINYDYIFSSTNYINERIVTYSKSGTNYPVLAVALNEDIIQNANGDNNRAVQNGFFQILFLVDQGNFQAQDNAWINAYEIARKIRTRMRDYKQSSPFCNNFIVQNAQKVARQVENKSADYLYGVSQNFIFDTSENLVTDIAVWLDLQ